MNLEFSRFTKRRSIAFYELIKEAVKLFQALLRDRHFYDVIEWDSYAWPHHTREPGSEFVSLTKRY